MLFMGLSTAMIGVNPGGAPGFDFDINGSVDNWDLNDELASAGYISGPVKITITVDGGVVVGSTSVTPGMTLQSQDVGVTIDLINNGTINGRGGPAGSAGGDALLVSHDTDLTNNGTIFGGGGGGGNGGSSSCVTCAGTKGTGGGGGGGVGEGNSAENGGSGGSNASGASANDNGESCERQGNFSVTGGAGGTGGTKGQTGSTGSGGAGGSCPGSGSSVNNSGGNSGAAGGNWANGHSFLNILTAGTTFGGTTG